MAAGLALWLCLVAVSMTANAMLPTPLPPDKDIITSCAAVSCLKGLECRIVIQSDSIGPLCLDPKKIPSDGGQKVCGSTGHPLLVAVEKRKRRSAALKSTRYKVFKCNEVCSALHLQLINGVCCADVDVCQLPKETGPCKANFPRYYFDTKQTKCLKFVFGGCKGNGNNFKTLDACKETCLAGVCGMPKDPGPCKALMPRYYYDADQNKCLKFNYGGCEGNRNNFKTLQSCQDVCDDYVCKLKQDPGPCRGFFPRYYYDADLKACHKFVYGGCQGNQNNFETLQRCQDTCLADVCGVPSDPGPCKASIPRYYYNNTEKQCLEFTYGGCQGNENNFKTLKDCQDRCGSSGICPPPLEPGICAITCNGDGDCGIGQKCCTTGCGGTTCDTAIQPPTCASTLCIVGTVCRDTPRGAICVTVKPGICLNILGPDGCFFTSHCEFDQDCPGNQKCCDVGCKGGDVCVNPLPGCAVVKCGNGTVCVETPTGPKCLPRNKPGECPSSFGTGVCKRLCNGDRECLGDHKCCRTSCGGHACTPPVAPQITCANVLCSPGTSCIESPDGPKCVPIRPGLCPLPECHQDVHCFSECEQDMDCHGKLQKCCPTCKDCNKCVDAALPPLCKNVPCGQSSECVLREVNCIFFPCYPLRVCVPEGAKDGVCPTPGLDPANQCPVGGDQCRLDQDCKLRDKCCEKNCGSKACTHPAPPNTCQDVICRPGEICREVLMFNHVVPQCLANLPPASAECKVGFPLQVFRGGVDEVFCGRGPNRQDCPPGYRCNISPVDRFAVCCRDQEPQCYPECGLGETCNTNKVVCKKPPCPPTPRCEDVCLQPKDPGNCLAVFERFYYDANTQQCLNFTYGGCGGNQNNFETVEQCQKTCFRHVCKLPRKPGPCKALIPRFYYNSDSKNCLPFNYGGCLGNANNFENFDQCLATCRGFKRGECPRSSEPGLCVCGDLCDADHDCPGEEKCCLTSCGGKVCLKARLTCSDLTCRPGKGCIETETGPVCVPTKPGQCPLFKCPIPFPKLCKDQCKQDSHCEGSQKCCFSCNGCNACFDPNIPNLCADVVCRKGNVCKLQEVVCVKAPCLPVPVCVPEERKTGQCPTPGPDSNSGQSCTDQCQGDHGCKGEDKCCSSLCGATTCTRPVLPNTCDDVRCGKDQVCREVLDSEVDQVTPTCFDQPPKPHPDATCPEGSPLLVFPKDGGDITVMFCGRGPNRTDCPDGYSCNISPIDAFAVCCRDRIPACHPICPPGSTCDRTQIACFVPPCPPTPRCVPEVPICRPECKPGYRCVTKPLPCLIPPCPTVNQCELIEKPGVCPKPGDLGICISECRVDHDCPGSKKCCSSGCGTVCQNPVCSSDTECPPDMTCDTDKGVCVQNKPGRCPPLPCPSLPPDFDFSCGKECKTDRDCNGTEKCCKNCIGCTFCQSPVKPTCFDLRCEPGTECLETRAGPQCLRINPGECPVFPCPPPPVNLQCKSTCEHDTDCQVQQKCCRDCTHCKNCHSPFRACDGVECETGELCELLDIQCITTPCNPVPVCISEERKKGQCPTPGPDSNSGQSCTDQCQGDYGCKGEDKCCFSLCGATTCTRPVLPNTCDDVKCGSGETCREVFHSETDEVVVHCLNQPPKPHPDATCPVGSPLLLRPDDGGDISVMFCGDGPASRHCPDGYNCNVSSVDAFAVCCRDSAPTCHPKCPRGTRCDRTPIACLVPPCPPTPRCVPIDRCLLPKDPGPCEAIIPRFYYDSNLNDCRPFDYGGCQGNANRFETRHDCQSACAEHVCNLPKDSGEEDGCQERPGNRYYFDSGPKQCKSFRYSGCGGNANRFSSRQKCLAVCR